MEYEEFVGRVKSRADISSKEKAEKAIEATLETLAERITGGEAKDLLVQLPLEFSTYLKQEHAEKPSTAENFSLDDFFRRLSKRADVGIPEATIHAQAVAQVLKEAVPSDQLDDVMSQLPREYHVLFEG